MIKEQIVRIETDGDETKAEVVGAEENIKAILTGSALTESERRQRITRTYRWNTFRMGVYDAVH